MFTFFGFWKKKKKKAAWGEKPEVNTCTNRNVENRHTLRVWTALTVCGEGNTRSRPRLFECTSTLWHEFWGLNQGLKGGLVSAAALRSFPVCRADHGGLVTTPKQWDIWSFVSHSSWSGRICLLTVTEESLGFRLFTRLKVPKRLHEDWTTGEQDGAESWQTFGNFYQDLSSEMSEEEQTKQTNIQNVPTEPPTSRRCSCDRGSDSTHETLFCDLLINYDSTVEPLVV